MALDFSTGSDETSEGPLDAVNSNGADEPVPTFGQHESGDEPLEPLPDDTSEAEMLHHKNPLGYTITRPTEDEIDELEDVGEPAKKTA